jgi:hypothetical protein
MNRLINIVAVFPFIGNMKMIVTAIVNGVGIQRDVPLDLNTPINELLVDLELEEDAPIKDLITAIGNIQPPPVE